MAQPFGSQGSKSIFLPANKALARFSAESAGDIANCNLPAGLIYGRLLPMQP
jgi:hypothetical protein